METAALRLDNIMDTITTHHLVWSYKGLGTNLLLERVDLAPHRNRLVARGRSKGNYTNVLATAFEKVIIKTVNDGANGIVPLQGDEETTQRAT